MVFLLQGVHHSLPGVRLGFHITRVKVADLTEERKLEKTNAMSVEFRGFGMATKKCEYAELARFEGKSSTNTKRSLKEK